MIPPQYPKRLIEVDLPIARISAHARREKSIRHGHISTLHIWWARRPLAACRAVICAALWPDPADPSCPQSFRETAADQLVRFAKRVNPPRISEEGRQLQSTLSEESKARWEAFTQNKLKLDPTDPDHQNTLRFALLDFIADFANWDNSTVPAYLETSRALTQAAHEALGGEAGTRPLVVDPFAGGGSIPLEALRVGADAFASDLNPVAVLLNKVVLEYIPKYGQKLADEVRKWGAWIKEQAEQELAAFYPKDPDGATPIAYLWARTVRCEGPGCGAEVPLMRSLWLAKKQNKSVALKIVPNPAAKRVDFEIIPNARTSAVGDGTVKRGSATCPCCGYTTPAEAVRRQLVPREGGSRDSRLVAVVSISPKGGGRSYRLPAIRDGEVINLVLETYHSQKSRLPHEELPYLRSIFNINILGVTKWHHLYSPRQALVVSTLASIVERLSADITGLSHPHHEALVTCLAMAVDRHVDQQSSLVTWIPNIEAVSHTFVRQALGITWDYCEPNPFSESGGNLDGAVEWVAKVIDLESKGSGIVGTSSQVDAAKHTLPDDIASLCFTDPPYYDAVPYADLSDYFFVWLKRMLGKRHQLLFNDELTPKKGEIVQLAERNEKYSFKTKEYFESLMTEALSEARRVVADYGMGVIVFAHKDTGAWETMLSSVINAGWIAVASWPIDTERSVRLRAQGSAALASSVHLVCRPRKSSNVGDWRDVLGELPQRMHEWMPRLAAEGVVGADAIFACLGPALEIFSRYSSVEKANGDPVLLKEYLEHVWAAVSKEALSTIFRDADASGLEPDARLTAMWLWTLGGGQPTPSTITDDSEDEEAAEDDEETPKAAGKASGFVLEFDAARKIAQGLGIHLEKSESIVEVKGDKATLLPVAARTKHLFGKATTTETKTKKKKKAGTPSLFAELDELEVTETRTTADLKAPPPGSTVLDRVHQAMILFGGQRGELLKRFLVEDGVGKDGRFWKLAQSLAALYPTGTDERRWVEGVLARKKGLGL